MHEIFITILLLYHTFNNDRVLTRLLQLIGRSVGQLFRKEVKIDNLPRIEVFGKSQQVRVDEISKNAADTGIAALFAGPT